jgi:hypothetical protein
MLAQLAAMIRLFDATSNPELIPPSRRDLFFGHGKQTRLSVDAQREAGGPKRARSVAEHAMLVKGLPVGNVGDADHDRRASPMGADAPGEARAGSAGDVGAGGLVGVAGLGAKTLVTSSNPIAGRLIKGVLLLLRQNRTEFYELD